MKTKICKIYLNNTNGTGFFCKISLPNKKNKLNVLITNNHIINEEIIKEKEIIIIKITNKSKRIELDNRIKYTNKKYDVTIIEIKEEDEIN